jgi:hypothetical protein
MVAPDLIHLERFRPTGTPRAVDEAIRSARAAGTRFADPALGYAVGAMAETVDRLVRRSCDQERFTVHISGGPPPVAVNHPHVLLDTVTNNDLVGSAQIILVDGDPGAQNLVPRYATVLKPGAQAVRLGIAFRSRIGIAQLSGSQTFYSPSDAPALSIPSPPRELGMQFTVSVPGTITAVRWYKDPTETLPHTVHIWDGVTTLPLVSVPVTSETLSGWQETPLPAPLAIAAGHLYVTSVNVNAAFGYTLNYFASSITRGYITAPLGAGVYANAPATYPNLVFVNSSYFDDVVFFPIGPSSQNVVLAGRYL